MNTDDLRVIGESARGIAGRLLIEAAKEIDRLRKVFVPVAGAWDTSFSGQQRFLENQAATLANHNGEWKIWRYGKVLAARGHERDLDTAKIACDAKARELGLNVLGWKLPEE